MINNVRHPRVIFKRIHKSTVSLRDEFVTETLELHLPPLCNNLF